MASTYNLTAPDAPASVEVTTRVKSSKFGDGYEQRSSDGLNPLKETWSLSWTAKTKVEIENILAFLESNYGALYFFWTTPRGHTKKFKCEKWSPSYSNDFDCSLSATFEQVYAL